MSNTRIQKTTDGGTTWSDHFITDNYLSQFMVEQVFFQDSQKGYIIGNYINKSSPNVSLSSGAVWMTTNGGQAWTRPYINEFSALPKALAFKNSTNGLVVGRGGLLVDLHSSGSASDTYRNRTYQDLKSIAFSSNANGEAVGGRLLLAPNSSNTLHDDSKSVSIRSTIAGAEWSKVENTRGSTLFQIRYKKEGEIGWKVGFRTLNVTKDGGSSWKNIYDDFGLPFNEGYTIAKAYLQIESSGFFLTADPYGTGSTSLFKFSSNTLTRIAIPYKDSGDPHNTSLLDLFFVNDQIGFITTSNGKLIKTTDAGASWSVQVAKSGSRLQRCFFVNEQVGWVIDSEGLILKTTDGGQTWTSQLSGTNVSLNALHFVSEQIGYIAGADGIVLKTTNGGATWIRQSTGTRNTLNDINFSDPEHGWIVGNDGTILKLVVSECKSLSDPVTIQMSTSPEATITASGTTAFCEGGTVDLIATAGSGYTYQWFKNNTALPNATGRQIKVGESGNYTVQVKNAAGCEKVSEEIKVIINPLPVLILNVPYQRTLCKGRTIEIKVQSSNSVDRYEWYRNGQVITNAGAANLVISESGTYEAKVTNSAGCTRTSEKVVINPPYQISLVAEGNTTFCEGENVKLSVQSSSSTLSSYQWYRNGTTIPGANVSSYIAVASGDYTVETVDTSRCNVISEPKQVVSRPLPAKPAITTGSNLKLVSSAATGNQWYLDGIAITGATSVEYSPVQSGRYTVQVTQEGCSSTMSEAYEFIITANNPILRTSVVIYPNPVSEQLFISIQDVAGSILVELINSAGQKVAQKHTYIANQQTTILPFEVGGLAAGTYVVRVQSSAFTKTTQVILIQ
ncbi:YCF48-related protein [Telluribacter sp. SYSU D00476]|uniref:YCF48-related protein n=1 Tax=Telluribacter sp. SYSU D00476 TaxID=2811430 RepID=UPI001FF4A0DB|nr:YCF48-related protein [Telluribacter sp. SYSU D00476]